MKKAISIIIRVLIALAIIGAIAFGAYSIYKVRNRTFTKYKVNKTTEIKNNSNAKILVGDKSIVKITRDGASAYDETGNEIWNVSYEMSNPVGDVCGDYAAVGDVGSTNLYIIGKMGELKKVSTEHMISLVKTSNLGSTAVWMSDGSKDYISVYSASGNKAVDMMTQSVNDGLPVAMGMSYDGSKLVTSYAYFEDSKMKNSVAFYNFGEMGADHIDRMVGVKKYDDRLVADIKFIGNNKVAAFSDKGVSLFDLDGIMKFDKDIEITDSIEAVSTSTENFAILSYNGASYKSVIYNQKGETVSERTLEKRCENYYLTGKELVMIDGTSLTVQRISGSDKAILDLGMDIKGLVPCLNEKTYMVMGEMAVNVIELLEEEKEK